MKKKHLTAFLVNWQYPLSLLTHARKYADKLVCISFASKYQWNYKKCCFEKTEVKIYLNFMRLIALWLHTLLHKSIRFILPTQLFLRFFAIFSFSQAWRRTWRLTTTQLPWRSGCATLSLGRWLHNVRSETYGAWFPLVTVHNTEFPSFSQVSIRDVNNFKN